MAYVNGKCPLCGSSIGVPEGKEQCYCQSCGKQILTSAAIAFAAATAAPQQPDFTTQYEPQASTAGFVQDKSFAANEGSASVGAPVGDPSSGSAAAYNPTPYQAEAVGARPLLDKWEKTPMGMAVLGAIFPLPAIVMLAAMVLVSALSQNASSAANSVSSTTSLVVIVAIFVVYCVACGVYALWVYPSLITDKPKIKSPGAAAYWNLAFGGIIFGTLWCSALTNKRKSNSQYVFIALLVISLAATLYSGYTQGFSELVPGTSSSPIASTNTGGNKTNNGTNTNNGNKTNNTASSVKTQSLIVVEYCDSKNSNWTSASGHVSLSSTSISISFTTKERSYSVSGEYLRSEDGYDYYQMNDGNYAVYQEVQGVKFVSVYTDAKRTNCLFDLMLE